eukprot:UN00488
MATHILPPLRGHHIEPNDAEIAGKSASTAPFQRGSFGYHAAPQIADGVDPANIQKFPKLTSTVRGFWAERKSHDFNIVSALDKEISDEIDELKDGTKIRLEPTQFTPQDARQVPHVDHLDEWRERPDGKYFHHNEMLRTKPAYMVTGDKNAKGDTIDQWMQELRAYIWQPAIQSYQTMPSRARIRLLDENGLSHGSGGRKNSRAQASVKAGSGKIFVNGQPYTEYFNGWEHRSQVIMPFYSTGTISQFDAFIKVKGGGYTGQAEAAKLAIANALQNFEPEFRPTLKVNGLLKRDPRMVERKHVGHKKARKSFAWVKR